MVFDILMDPGIIAAVQTFSPGLTSVMVDGEFLDTMPWYLLVFSLITFGLHPRHGMRLATLFGINGGLNEAVKLAWHLPRPYWVSAAVSATSSHSSFGFPSGAAQYGIVLYGYIAANIRRFWVIILCIFLLCLTSSVRIFAGIHFFQDIIGGWIIGLFLLAAFLFFTPWIETFTSRLSQPVRITLIFFVAAIPLLLAIPALLSIGDWQVPVSWIEQAQVHTGKTIHPEMIQFSCGAAGIILGSLLGYEFLLSRGGWNPPDERIIRFGVIIGGTIAVLLFNTLLQTGMKMIGFTAINPLLETFLRMTVVLFWLIGCLPLIAKFSGYCGRSDISE
jgi:membrane-associated phospholipid phosphatase